jgi:CheY-like chemotaxis protein
MQKTLPDKYLDITQFSVMGSKKVLVIDDEPAVRTIVQCCLEDIAGWDVIPAGSGQEGLVHAAADVPDAIVLDMMMPGMDGLTFLKELRAKPDIPVIPVVVLSAKSHLANVPAFEGLGVAGIISKPFDALSICDRIAAFLGWTIDSSVTD